MQNRRKMKSIAALLLSLIMLAFIYLIWAKFFKPNVPHQLASEYVNIPTGSSLDDVVRILKEGQFIIDENSFRQTAVQMKYKGRPGRYKIKGGWSNFFLVRHLKGGKQSPVKVVLVNERLPENVAGKVSKVIEADSLSLLAVFKDSTYLDSLGYTPETVMCLFIPNTYEFYWNTNARKFLNRMKRENEAFWNKNNRTEKAAKLGLTQKEVYILASIVERETNAKSEMPRIAGLYLNRLRLGWRLEADPTLVFASRDWETRSIAKYKKLDSPYNTYLHVGLPPGPIGMASIAAIDAVLNPEDHDYLFMCAIGDGSGLHAFAETYSAHLVNVERYKQNLISRGLGL